MFCISNIFFIRFYFYESCTDRIKKYLLSQCLETQMSIEKCISGFQPTPSLCFPQLFPYYTNHIYYLQFLLLYISIRFYHLLIPIFLHLFEIFFIRDIFPTPASPTRTTLITSASSLI